MSSERPSAAGGPAKSNATANANTEMPSGKAQRVLACVLCQHRKVKCSRSFPCSNCTKVGVQCVPGAMIPRQRKRRFPEKELLGRIRHYEALLCEHGVDFEPLHGSHGRNAPVPGNPNKRQGEGSSLEPDSLSSFSLAGGSGSSPSATSKSDGTYEPKNFWHAMNRGLRDPDESSDSSTDDVPQVMVKAALSFGYQDDHLLFGSSGVDVSSLHPDPVRMFRLWQCYLECVDPLLKVTHSPTLQSRIVEAASHVDSIPPALEALMFSIYFITVMTLEPDECRATFGSSKRDLLASYRFGCQQALTNAGFLQSKDRDCLTALFLYLLAVGRDGHPQSISALYGVAIRVSQHMEIHNEESLAKLSPFEAEMCRRLWWALMLFDSRMGEVSGCMHVSLLVPTWDCKIPLNVNDSELRQEMSELPAPARGITDATFVVVRAEFGTFLRNALFHLEFTCPVLIPLAKDDQQTRPVDGWATAGLEKMLEEKYLRLCDEKTPFQFFIAWLMRAHVSRIHLIEHYSKSTDPAWQTEARRGRALSYALRTLSYTTKIVASPLSKRYRWLLQYYFPLPAYVHVVQELKLRPLGEPADRAWVIMAENYDLLIDIFIRRDHDYPIFKVFARPILAAWEVRLAALVERKEPVVPPKLVTRVQEQLARIEEVEQKFREETSGDTLGMNHLGLGVPMGLEALGGQMDGDFGSGYTPALDGIVPDQLDWGGLQWG